MTTVTRRTKINIRIVEEDTGRYLLLLSLRKGDRRPLNVLAIVNVWSLVSMRAGALILAALVPTIPSTPALIKGLVSSGMRGILGSLRKAKVDQLISPQLWISGALNGKSVHSCSQGREVEAALDLGSGQVPKTRS
ncbi:N-acetylmuramic acid 6-phosphate etherase 2 [Striga asiatica]|uniref:N-acetylmuramic acid 6-phosphate etherase 2 n=1 Tax=Striga asiatica TaxID=4170 RepID=A0A5A7Q229_STRAF|nr:N-acetylmuramic acid 6-phosphate etherase 2 [Striga asiatica]